MNLFEALVLGLIQGLTEFLPISSSAHVQIAQELMGITSLTKPQLTAFIATIQIGTEVAVLIYFAKTILEILSSWFKNALRPFSTQPQESKLGWLVILGSLPVVALGLAFQDQVESDVRQLWVIGVALIVFGLALGIADRFGSKTKELTDLNLKSGLIFGLGQALALIPGVSRSGGTITVGRLMGFTRAAAAKYSFLLAIPAVLASGAYQFLKSYQDLPTDLIFGTAVATLVSGIVGYLVIAWLLKYLERGSFLPFVIWRVTVGTLLLVGLSLGAI